MQAEARTAFWLAVRHHPLCDRFDADRFGPFCSGCVIFWPGFFAATIAASSAWLAGAAAWAMLGASIILGAPQLLSLRWRFARSMRATIKLLGGFAVGTALPAILLLPAGWLLRGALLGLMAAAFAFILAQRMRSMLAVCDACVWRRDWGRCPGFGALDANTTLTWRESQP